MKPSLKSPLVMALTLGVFLALAGGTLAVTGAFDAEKSQSNPNAAECQYEENADLAICAEVDVTVGRPNGGPGAGAGVGVGVGAGGAGAGAGADAGVAGADTTATETLCAFRIKVLSGSLVKGRPDDDLCNLDDQSLDVKSGSPTDWIAYFDDSKGPTSDPTFLTGGGETFVAPLSEPQAGSDSGSGAKLQLEDGDSSLGVLYDGRNTKTCELAVSLFDFAGNDGKGEWVRLFKRDVGPKGIHFEGPAKDGDASYVKNGEARARVRCVQDGVDFVNITDRLTLIPGTE